MVQRLHGRSRHVRSSRASVFGASAWLMHLAADDPEGQSRVAAFLQGLQEAGWAVGRNVNIDVRWAAGEADRYRRYAMEIVALTPDVILTSAPPSIRASRSIAKG